MPNGETDLKRRREMKHYQSVLSNCVSVFAIGTIIFSFLTACYMHEAKKEIDITSRTTYSGFVNDYELAIDVVATINTTHGGTSNCTFTKLPPKFNPATLGTHA